MKFSKASIIITLLTFLVFAASVANLVICLNSGEQIPMGIGIAVVMFGIFVACVITAIRDAKNAGRDTDLDDDDDDDDDDDE